MFHIVCVIGQGNNVLNIETAAVYTKCNMYMRTETVYLDNSVHYV